MATVFGNKVTLVGPGSTVITAQQEIDNRGFYNPAIPVTQTLTVKNPGNVTLFTSSLHDYKNSEVLVPVRATGFNKIISSQFSVTWDPNVITYLGTESFNLSGMDANAFGLTQASSGRLSVAWFEPHLLPQTIADNDTLFLIRFKLTGSYGSSTPVEIGNQPLNIELIDNTHSALATATQAGTVSINVDISISGKVYYPNHEAIQQVTVNLNEGLQSATSSSNGDYHFDAPAGSTYSVEPQKINDPHAINGIDAADIAALRRHILGVQILDSPYKIIAGDVNSSQSLSTIDLVLIQELILGINSFPVDKQWTFVLADYTFAGDSPFPYPSNVTLTQVDGQIAQDFVGVKFGDVNISRDNTQQDRLTNNAVIFLLEENKVDSSEIEVIVRVKNFTSISAYQFTLTWDPSRFDYLPSVRQNSDAAFGTSNVVDGALSVLWDDKSGRFANLEDETELFRFSLAKRVIDATVKDVNITSTITPAAVYNNELKRVPYQVLWKDPNDAPVSFALLQNYPNSFSQKTNIFFDVPEEGEVQLSIIDSNGREITTWRNSCAVGRHVFEWSGVDEQGSQVVPGLYVCVARYGSLTKFIKMIKN